MICAELCNEQNKDVQILYHDNVYDAKITTDGKVECKELSIAKKKKVRIIIDRKVVKCFLDHVSSQKRKQIDEDVKMSADEISFNEEVSQEGEKVLPQKEEEEVSLPTELQQEDFIEDDRRVFRRLKKSKDELSYQDLHERVFDSYKYHIFNSLGEKTSDLNSASYIVNVKNSVVVCCFHKGCLMSQFEGYLEEKFVGIKYAPCVAQKFCFQDDGEIKVKLRFLLTNKELDKDHTESETHVWPLDCLVAHCSHLSSIEKKKFLKDYSNHLAAYGTHKLCSTGRTIGDHVADFFDFLEFFYVPDHLLFKTQLGFYIQRTYLETMFFNNERQTNLLSRMLNSPKLRYVSFNSDSSQCIACGKNDIVCKILSGDDSDDLEVGKFCAGKLMFAQHVGSLIRDFRSQSYFRVEKGVSMLDNIAIAFKPQ